MGEDAFKEQGKKNIFHHKNVLEQEKPKLKDPKYADAPFVDADQGKKVDDIREKLAKNAEKPTSASSDKKDDQLPQIMQKVDPQKKAQVIPEMYQQMQQLKNILNAGAASGGGGGSNQQQNEQGTLTVGNSVVSSVLDDALAGAFVNFSKLTPFTNVISIILSVLDNGGLEKINSLYQQTVINATLNFIRLALYYGPNDIPVTTYQLVPDPKTTATPDKVVEYSEVPSMYVRQWYALETNPYPSHITWVSSDGKTKLYTLNDSYYYFETSSQEIYYITESGLTNDLKKYFVFDLSIQKIFTLTPEILSDVLDKYALIIEKYNIDVSLGKDVGDGVAQDSENLNNQNQQGGGGGGGSGIGQMMGMLQGMLGGQLKDHMQNIMQKQLPKSVNDTQKINKNIQLSTQDMANNKKAGDSIEKMFGMDSNGGLGGMNLQGIMQGFQSGGGGSSGGSSGGGGSGGGGGGAGSGVPSGQGPYTGGDVPSGGLVQIQSLLSLLGVS